MSIAVAANPGRPRSATVVIAGHACEVSRKPGSLGGVRCDGDVISSSEVCWNGSEPEWPEGPETAGACDCAADLDGDGVVGERDLAAMLDSWSTSDPVADLDLDGVVDEDDLSILLLEWSRPCASITE